MDTGVTKRTRGKGGEETNKQTRVRRIKYFTTSKPGQNNTGHNLFKVDARF